MMMMMMMMINLEELLSMAISSRESSSRQSIDHPEPRSITINQQLTPHLTLLNFIDARAHPISAHTLLDSIAMADPSITRISLPP